MAHNLKREDYKPNGNELDGPAFPRSLHTLLELVGSSLLKGVIMKAHVKQDNPYLQGHYDYFHGPGVPQSTNKQYIKGFNDARMKSIKIVGRKEKSKRKNNRSK